MKRFLIPAHNEHDISFYIRDIPLFEQRLLYCKELYAFEEAGISIAHLHVMNSKRFQHVVKSVNKIFDRTFIKTSEQSIFKSSVADKLTDYSLFHSYRGDVVSLFDGGQSWMSNHPSGVFFQSNSFPYFIDKCGSVEKSLDKLYNEFEFEIVSGCGLGSGNGIGAFNLPHGRIFEWSLEFKDAFKFFDIGLYKNIPSVNSSDLVYSTYDSYDDDDEAIPEKIEEEKKIIRSEKDIEYYG